MLLGTLRIAWFAASLSLLRFRSRRHFKYEGGYAKSSRPFRGSEGGWAHKPLFLLRPRRFAAIFHLLPSRLWQPSLISFESARGVFS